MSAHERLVLARLAYARAIARVRARSTGVTWLRLRTAARNVGAATLEVEHARARGHAGPTGITKRPDASAGVAPGRTTARVLLLYGRAAAEPPGDVGEGVKARSAHPTAWLEILAEWQRARALMSHSRALVRQARALWQFMAPFQPARAKPLAHRRPAHAGYVPGRA